MFVLLTFVALVAAQSQVTATTSSGQTYIVRLETATTNGGTFTPSAIGGQVTAANQGLVGAININFRNGVGGQLLTPVGGSISAISGPVPSLGDDSYQVISFLSSSQINLVLCLNNTILFPGGEQCVNLQPIGSAGSFVNRATVTVTQQFQVVNPTLASCSLTTGSVTGTCQVASVPNPALLSLSITPSVVNEQVTSQRDCSVEPVFARGTIGCPVFVGRTLSGTETAFLTSSADILTTSLPTTALATPLFNIPRNAGYQFGTLPGGLLGGSGALGGTNRGIEAFFTSSSSVQEQAFDTFFLAIVNVAHREQINRDINNLIIGAQNVLADATVVVQDASNRVLHYVQDLPIVSATTPQFVEVFFTSSEPITVSAVLRAAGFQNTAFNGSLAAGGVTVNSISFTTVANHYYVVALNTADDPTTGYLMQEFDVTPVNNLVGGTQEEQILNLVRASSSSSQSSVANAQGTFTPQNPPSFSGLQFFQVSPATNNLWNCALVSSIGTLPSGNSILVNGSFSGLTVATNAVCPNPTNLATSTVSLGAASVGSTSCTRRVTLFYGRPYTVQTPTCTINNFASPSCLTNGVTNTVQIGGLDFVGNTFLPAAAGNQLIGNTAFTTTPTAFPAPVTIDIAYCSCIAAPVTTCNPSNCDILTAITGSSGSVSGTVSGLSGSISGVASGVTSVLAKLSSINSTLLTVKNLDLSIQKLVKKRC